MAEETTDVAEAPENTESAVTETAPETAMVDTSAFCKIIAEAFPDEDLTSPEACLAKLSETLDLFKKERAAIKIMNEAFEAEPRLAAVVSDHATGKRKNLISAIAAHFDPEEFTAGPEDEEELAAAMSERKANKEAMQSRMTELDGNLEESRVNIESFMNEQGLTPETIQPFITYIDAVHKAFYDGKLTKAELIMLWKGFNHDASVGSAYDEGKTDGMNERIVEKKIGSAKTDGIPVVVASSESTEAPRPLKKNPHNVRWEEKLEVKSVK